MKCEIQVTMMTGIHQVPCVCIVHTLGHEDTNNSFVQMCVW